MLQRKKKDLHMISTYYEKEQTYLMKYLLKKGPSRGKKKHIYMIQKYLEKGKTFLREDLLKN